ncbi:TetR/AcrR family transcriptional regulator [Magnetococcus sp. PR-3]|uniref:TetR/AcrR family transcriptional regulator n=1 Tax=Magnetococcus sp. PR-3 TaxID=3120355 RepID=UPI002FCE2175
MQVRKAHIRQQILTAAEQQFAQRNYSQVTMGAIAGHAGISTGNIYTYFPNKKALFQAVLPPEFIETFLQLTQKRIAAFSQPQGLSPHTCTTEAQELTQFWINNRLKVIILLARAEGSEHADFTQHYIHRMTEQTLQQLPDHLPTLKVTEVVQFTFNTMLVNDIHTLVSILQTFDETSKILKAFEAAGTYQMAGLQAFTAWCCPPETP